MEWKRIEYPHTKIQVPMFSQHSTWDNYEGYAEEPVFNDVTVILEPIGMGIWLGYFSEGNVMFWMEEPNDTDQAHVR